ncbi:hypothetical protein PsW64_03818 [Pseudovibrio sp. W64]|nr:hypothetical protein [Pseudovibrio sp. W64]KZK78179.1 hypothetical protein PsW64_03818 [Pseudovibrio sp. W64]
MPVLAWGALAVAGIFGVGYTSEKLNQSSKLLIAAGALYLVAKKGKLI